MLAVRLTDLNLMLQKPFEKLLLLSLSLSSLLLLLLLL